MVPLDSLNFSGLAWAYKLQPNSIHRSAYEMLGHSPVPFRDQQMVSKDNTG
jgi:hypothetical protein